MDGTNGNRVTRGDGEILGRALKRLVGLGKLPKITTFADFVGLTTSELDKRLYGYTPLDLDMRWSILRELKKFDKETAEFAIEMMTNMKVKIIEE